MKVEAHKLSSFTQCINGGNSAGVILDADSLSSLQMQQLAECIGFSETAFVGRSQHADFSVRFFTPCAEVDLCGHATIAAFSLLKQRNIIQEGEYTQETKAGILKIQIKDNTIYMQQAMPQFYEIIEGEELLRCIGINKNELADKLAIQAVSTGLKDIMVPLKDEGVLKNLKPDMGKIEEISKKYNAVGLHVFTVNEYNDGRIPCRNFAPLYGIPEESATGTSNGALACYLYNYGIIAEEDTEITFEQGMYMGKPSIIKAKLEISNNTLENIWVGGEAVIIGEDTYQI